MTRADAFALDTSGVRHRTWPERSAQPASAEFLRLADLVRVWAPVVRPGGLEHGRQPFEARVREEHAEPFTELALEDVRVPVAIRTERRSRVVDVQRPQPV